MDEHAPGPPPSADDAEQATESEQSVEPAWKRRRRLAAVFGDVLPDTTSDEQDDAPPEQRDDAQDRWLRSQVPPHHG